MPYADPEKQRQYHRDYHRAWYHRNKEKCRERTKKYRENNPEKVKAAFQKWCREHPRWWFKYTYGITNEQYLELRKAQNSCCAVCGRKLRRLAVDHDHKTGKIRALLCINCNGGLGNFKDSIETMRLAIAYLERHQ